jgi:hypothetical protein
MQFDAGIAPRMMMKRNLMMAEVAMCDDVTQESYSAKRPKPIAIRKDFPETWIFDNFEFDEEYRKSNIFKNSKINFSISFAALQLPK